MDDRVSGDPGSRFAYAGRSFSMESSKGKVGIVIYGQFTQNSLYIFEKYGRIATNPGVASVKSLGGPIMGCTLVKRKGEGKHE